MRRGEGGSLPSNHERRKGEEQKQDKNRFATRSIKIEVDLVVFNISFRGKCLKNKLLGNTRKISFSKNLFSRVSFGANISSFPPKLAK